MHYLISFLKTGFSSVFVLFALFVPVEVMAIGGFPSGQPEPVQISLDATELTNAINQLQQAISALDQEMENQLPGVTTAANDLVATLKQFLDLFDDSIPKAQASVDQINDSFSRFVVLTENIWENKVAIACTGAAVIAAGIVVGHLANEYIFSLDKKKNVIYRSYQKVFNCAGACYNWAQAVNTEKACTIKSNSHSSIDSPSSIQSIPNLKLAEDV